MNVNRASDKDSSVNKGVHCVETRAVEWMCALLSLSIMIKEMDCGSETGRGVNSGSYRVCHYSGSR